MASSSSQSSRSSARRGEGTERMGPPVPYRVAPLAYSPAVMCHCNRKAPCWVSWSNENPGRRYYRCPSGMTNRDCGYYRWIDRERTSFERTLLVDLRDAVWDLRKENAEMRREKEELQRVKEQEVASLKAEYKKQLEEKDASMAAMAGKMEETSRRPIICIVASLLVGLLYCLLLAAV